jgi:hypothetical protein
MVVLVHDGVYPWVTRRDAGCHVGHQDVADAFTRRQWICVSGERVKRPAS